MKQAFQLARDPVTPASVKRRAHAPENGEAAARGRNFSKGTSILHNPINSSVTGWNLRFTFHKPFQLRFSTTPITWPRAGRDAGVPKYLVSFRGAAVTHQQ